MTLSDRVVREDHKLERSAERTREDLARHRWHWTLDESNPRRVPVGEYARGVGRNRQTIHDMVNGYAAWLVRGAPDGIELTNELARAKLRGNDVTATEAVAKARGVSIESARRHHRDEVAAVKREAVERAETSGGTVAEEAERVATFRKKAADARKREAEAKRKRHSLRFVAIDGKFADARRVLLAALTEAQDVEFTDEERELLARTSDELHQILSLITLRVVGETSVDWDAELVKLGERPA